MKVEELEALKKKIETAKQDKAKSEGAIEQIEKTWKDDFGCKTVEEVKAKVKDTEGQIKTLNEKFAGYMKEIETAMGEVE